MAHVKSVIDFKLFYNPLPDTKHNNIKSVLIIKFEQTDQWYIDQFEFRAKNIFTGLFGSIFIFAVRQMYAGVSLIVFCNVPQSHYHV